MRTHTTQYAITDMLLFFLQGVALAFPNILLPSPFKLFLISQALQKGWRKTLPACCAPWLTDGFIVALALFVLSQIPPWFVSVLRLAGGLFILYLAWKAMVRLRQGGAKWAVNEAAAQRSFWQAVGINILNPNPYILWGVVAGPIVLQAWREQSPAVGLSFVLGFYLMFVLGLVGLTILFGTVGQMSERLNKLLSVLAAVSLLLFGFYQLWVGVTAIFL